MKNRKILFSALLIVAVSAVIGLISLVTFRIAALNVASSPSATAEIVTDLPDYIKSAPPGYSKPVIDSVGWSLKRESIRVNNDVPYLDFLVVSSGRFYTVTLPIDNHPVMDVVDAYIPLKTGVVSIPVPIGISDGYEQYLYFDSGRDISQSIEREYALLDAHQRLQRGQVFNLSIFKYVSLGGVDWSKCIAQEDKPDVARACQYAKQFSLISPKNAERMFISKILLDGHWLPVGWWFMVYRPDKVVLPEE